MLHIVLLATFTAGVATLTFALMALASLLSIPYPSSPIADGWATLSAELAQSPSSASDGTPPLFGSGTLPGAQRGSTPERSESRA